MDPPFVSNTLDFYHTKSPSAIPKPFFFQNRQFLRCHMSSFSKTSVFTTISEPVATGYVVAGWAGWAAVWLVWLGCLAGCWLESLQAPHPMLAGWSGWLAGPTRFYKASLCGIFREPVVSNNSNLFSHNASVMGILFSYP